MLGELTSLHIGMQGHASQMTLVSMLYIHSLPAISHCSQQHRSQKMFEIKTKSLFLFHVWSYLLEISKKTSISSYHSYGNPKNLLLPGQCVGICKVGICLKLWFSTHIHINQNGDRQNYKTIIGGLTKCKTKNFKKYLVNGFLVCEELLLCLYSEHMQRLHNGYDNCQLKMRDSAY